METKDLGCCGDGAYKNIYVPLNRRLLEWGKESTSEEAYNKYPYTKLWVFTFIDNSVMCVDCVTKFNRMVEWFTKYGLLTNPVNNTKWVVEGDMSKCLIAQDIGITKSPTTYFCDQKGNIVNIITGFPENNWLEEYILPIVVN
jgi:hypothetical protein